MSAPFLAWPPYHRRVHAAASCDEAGLAAQQRLSLVPPGLGIVGGNRGAITSLQFPRRIGGTDYRNRAGLYMFAALTRISMPRFTRSIDIKAPVEAVFAFHLDPANLVRIAPAGTRSRLLSCTGTPIQVGSRVVVQSVQAGIPVQIEAEVVTLDPPNLLEDRQVRGPFAWWTHRHTFEEIPGGTRLTDEVDYALPMGALGGFVMGRTVERELKANFEHRQSETRRLLEGD